jgi:hypothetical protein
MLQDDFERLGRLVTRPLFARLAFPRDLALLPAVHEALRADLGASTP